MQVNLILRQPTELSNGCRCPAAPGNSVTVDDVRKEIASYKEKMRLFIESIKPRIDYIEREFQKKEDIPEKEINAEFKQLYENVTKMNKTVINLTMSMIDTLVLLNRTNHNLIIDTRVFCNQTFYNRANEIDASFSSAINVLRSDTWHVLDMTNTALHNLNENVRKDNIRTEIKFNEIENTLLAANITVTGLKNDTTRVMDAVIPKGR